MKYLKACGFILFGAIFSYSFSTNNTSSTDRRVRLFDAQPQVDNYLFWLKLAPTYFSLNDTTIRYQEKKISKFEAEVIGTVIDAYNAKHPADSISLSAIPYNARAHGTTSYFISYDDLNIAKDKCHNCKGIRVYMAMNKVDYSKSYESVNSHVFITPAVNDTTDYLMKDSGGEYVLDLTTPCPNACPTNSVFGTFQQGL